MRDLSRRSFIKIMGVAGMALLSGCQDAPGQEATPGTSSLPVDLDSLRAAPTELVITPTGDFFVQSFSGIPRVVEEEWSLRIFGLVERALDLTYQDVLQLPKVEEVRTLECIGNPIGGSLVGNALWGGFEAAQLWSEAGILPEAVRGRFGAVDGYFTSVDLTWLTQPGVLMAYEMNGETLSLDHGFPLRILMPGLYGQKMPKWITEIEFVDNRPLGYWERQGWSDTASVKTNSSIWYPANLGRVPAGAVPVYGMAFAGLRNIARVDVRIDDGPWTPAELLQGESSLVWTQWSYAAPLDAGNHTVAVRAMDDEGFVQSTESGSLLAGAYPDGTDEIHKVVFVVNESS